MIWNWPKFSFLWLIPSGSFGGIKPSDPYQSLIRWIRENQGKILRVVILYIFCWGVGGVLLLAFLSWLGQRQISLVISGYYQFLYSRISEFGIWHKALQISWNCEINAIYFLYWLENYGHVWENCKCDFKFSFHPISLRGSVLKVISHCWWYFFLRETK